MGTKDDERNENQSNNNNNDDVEIISTHDERIKIVGEILSNDSSRKILNLLNDDKETKEMTINEIAQQTGLSISLITHHLKRMQSVQVVKISRVGRSVKGQKMNYYSATNQSFLIVPSKEPIHSVKNSLKKFSKFFAIGMAGFVSWAMLNSSNNSSLESSQSAGLRASIVVDDDQNNLSVSDEQQDISAESKEFEFSESTEQYDQDLQVSSSVQKEPSAEIVIEEWQSGKEQYIIEDLSEEGARANTGSVSLDRTIYPEPQFAVASADSPEIFALSGIIIPIGIIIGGIVLERMLSRWYRNRKRD